MTDIIDRIIASLVDVVVMSAGLLMIAIFSAILWFFASLT